MLAELLALVAPPRCAAVRRGMLGPTHLCERCESRLGDLRAGRQRSPGWTALVGRSVHGAARDLVLALKFGARLALAQRAAAAIAAQAPAELLARRDRPCSAGSVAPAMARLRPCGGDRRGARDAYRAGRLAAACAARRAGARSGDRARSGSPSRRAFGHRAPSPAAAILVDDVVTTGATLGACARALRSAGCGHVVALTFARS